MSTEEGDKLHVVTADDISNNKKRLGKFLVWGSAIILRSEEHTSELQSQD